MKYKIPLFKTYSDKNDIKAVADVIKRGSFWAVGPDIAKVEKKIAKFIGVKYALLFNSGTSALHSLCLAYNLKGGEVIVPSFTFIATANAAVLAGAKPVFAESESDTFGLDIADVRKKVNKKTKAVILIHYGGCASRDTEKLRKLCNEKKIILIEDAAQSFGTTINKKRVGSFGDAAIFSFCQNKVISCGEGGVVLTNSREIYEKSKLLRSHGRVEESDGDYFCSIGDNDYIEVGYNFRMSSMAAALLGSQLKNVSKLRKLRRQKANFLNKELVNIEAIKYPKSPKGFDHVYQMYTIIVKNESLRNDLQKFLADKGIMTKVYFNPIHLKTFYKKCYNYKEGSLPLTEELSNRVLTLPMSAVLTQSELKYIAGSIKKFFKLKKYNE